MEFRRQASSFSFTLITIGLFAFCILSVNCGRQYIFAPTSNHRRSTHFDIGMVFQTLGQEETDIRVSFPRRSYEDHIILPPGSPPYNYTLPESLISHKSEAGIFNSTVFVTSEQDIAVVSYNFAFKSSDTFSLIPAEFLGKEYFITLISGVYNDTIIISAFEKKVMVKIFLTSSIQLQNDTYNDGDTLRLVLLPFESFQLISKYTNITGSRITANSSIAVTVGSECANVPEGLKYCDHLAEQLAPVKAWGMLHVLGPFPRRRSGYVFQIVASRNGTTAIYNDNTVNMNMGDYITVDNPSQNMTFVYADKPISVMQYSKGRSSDNNSYSDPSMIRVNPIKQYVTRTTIPVFEFNKTSSNDTSYIGITAECKHFRGISIYRNNQLLSVMWDEEYSLQIQDGMEMCSKWMVAAHGRYSVEGDDQGTYPGFHPVVYGTSFGKTHLYRAGSTDKDLTTSEAASVAADICRIAHLVIMAVAVIYRL
ncbi:IgGFc-binding protein-like [Lytechinus variegatus]|uniref:IgGFc-binding protein-like n=1 Tax=Lytechinus variegatus TaxID=7654 RepID=UPI001BB1F2FB|nr:IgGFc-binding protein-like [Lytechinus variegatus]XP_041476127.1 IgGFc-binding protein-like [Lytechinus variegatus]